MYGRLKCLQTVILYIFLKMERNWKHLLRFSNLYRTAPLATAVFDDSSPGKTSGILLEKLLERKCISEWPKVWISNVSRLHLRPNSLYRSRSGSYFYGTEYEIWADFRPVGNTKIQIWGRFEGGFFMSSWTKTKFNFF